MTGRADGFTLLEVLIALVIAALALGLFYRAAIEGIGEAQTAGTYAEALSLARSHLAEISARNAAHPANARGEDGALFRYEISVTPIASQPLDKTLLEQANNRPARIATLYAVRITEWWRRGGHRRQVRLLGEALASAPGAQ